MTGEGRCPINGLPEFATNHYDTDTLCGLFSCKECVASPEDLGYGEHEPPGDYEEGWEIPF